MTARDNPIYNKTTASGEIIIADSIMYVYL